MTPFKIEPSGDYVQLIYVDAVSESVQQELRSDTDAFECSYDSDGKLFMQFGAMRFENPEPTDFEIDGSEVTDAADFISKLNALFTGGGGSGFPSSISEDTTVDLNEKVLYFKQGAHGGLSINEEGYVGVGVPNSGYLWSVIDEANNIIEKVDMEEQVSWLKMIDPIDSTYNSGVVVSASSVGEGGGTGIARLQAQAGIKSGSVSVDAGNQTVEFSAANGIKAVDLIFFDFVDDAAAASGGIPVGGLYHNSGALRIRLS